MPHHAHSLQTRDLEATGPGVRGMDSNVLQAALPHSFHKLFYWHWQVPTGGLHEVDNGGCGKLRIDVHKDTGDFKALMGVQVGKFRAVELEHQLKCLRVKEMPFAIEWSVQLKIHD